MIPDQMIMLFINETERGMAAILKVLEQLYARLNAFEATKTEQERSDGDASGTRV